MQKIWNKISLFSLVLSQPYGYKNDILSFMRQFFHPNFARQVNKQKSTKQQSYERA
jgi:hypothetical protein